MTEGARLTLPQQIVVNLMAHVALSLRSTPDVDMALAEIAAQLPVARGAAMGRQIAAVIAAADEVLAADKGLRTGGGGLTWAVAQMTAWRALATFFLWRAACAQEALQPEITLAPQPTLEVTR